MVVGWREEVARYEGLWSTWGEGFGFERGGIQVLKADQLSPRSGLWEKSTTLFQVFTSTMHALRFTSNNPLLVRAKRLRQRQAKAEHLLA